MNPLRAYLSKIGRVGGSKTSAAKRAAARRNWRLAQRAIERKRKAGHG